MAQAVCGQITLISTKKDHRFKREILRSNFLSPKDLYEAEREEILKYCFECEDGHYKVDRSTGCMNNKTTCQPDQTICLECGTFSNSHKKTCSLYKSPTPCPECGGVYGHRKGCSKYVVGKTCSECGGIDNKHKKSCSKYKTSPNCPECGGIEGRHRKGCSKYKEGRTCPECGGKNNSHKKGCSNYVEIPPCPECGGLNGQHKKGCSKYVETICPECGGRGSHFKTCSHYNPPTDCPECGAKWGHHLSTCSQFKNSKACPICGSLTTHKKDCPHYKADIYYASKDFLPKMTGNIQISGSNSPGSTLSAIVEGVPSNANIGYQWYIGVGSKDFEYVVTDIFVDDAVRDKVGEATLSDKDVILFKGEETASYSIDAEIINSSGAVVFKKTFNENSNSAYFKPSESRVYKVKVRLTSGSTYFEATKRALEFEKIDGETSQSLNILDNQEYRTFMCKAFDKSGKYLGEISSEKVTITPKAKLLK